MSAHGKYASRTIDTPDDHVAHENSASIIDAPSLEDLNAITTLALTRKLIEPNVADGFARTLMRAYRASLTHRHHSDDTLPIHLRYVPVHYPPQRLRLALVRLDAAIHDTPYIAGIPAERVLAELITITAPPAKSPSAARPTQADRTPIHRQPRVLNKRTHGMPPGAVYCGRGSYWANPFTIGQHGTRDEVCDRFEREVLPLLDLSALGGRDLVCFCAPKRCHCDALLCAANPA